jgi:hypothetical protein
MISCEQGYWQHHIQHGMRVSVSRCHMLISLLANIIYSRNISRFIHPSYYVTAYQRFLASRPLHELMRRTM